MVYSLFVNSSIRGVIKVSLLVVCWMCLATAAQSQLASSAWPTFGQNARHTFQSPYQFQGEDTTRWHYNFFRIITASPVVGPTGRVYIGSPQALHAVNPDGTRRWRLAFEDTYGVTSPAISADSILYTGTASEKIVAVTPEGEKQWTFNTSNFKVVEPPTIGPEGTIYATSIQEGPAVDGNLYALAPAGTLKWKLHMDPAPSMPAVNRNGGVVFSSAESIYKASPKGKIQWQFKTNFSVRSVPAIGPDGRIYVGNDAGMVYALSPDGNLQWKYKAGNSNIDDGTRENDYIGAIDGAPAIAGDSLLYVVSADGHVEGDSGYVHAIRHDGTLAWEHPFQNISSVSPTVSSSGTIFVGALSGIYALNPDGAIRWHYGEPKPGPTTLAIGKHGTIYTGGEDSTLHALGGRPPLPISDHPSVPQAFTLHQNYPNPFNPTTTIKYTIPENTYVRITVFNLMGRKIRTLFNGFKEKGKHSIRFNANGLSGGVYFYRLVTENGNKETDKMMLIK